MDRVRPKSGPDALDNTLPGESLDDSAPRTRSGEVPRRLGRYLVIERVGAGAMGVVYSAYDPQLDRKVALKVLAPGRGDAGAQAELLREAKAMAQLSHPHVVAVHDAGEHEQSVYIAMEFVRGQTLRSWLAERRRSWREVLDVYLQAALGLAEAHRVGLVHRDFKPDNVLIDEHGRARVTDFGLAYTTSTSSGPHPRVVANDENDAPKRMGRLVGTPAYMAAEQFAGGATDARTDQFGLCVALWEGLYGRRPFAGTTVPELALAVMGRPDDPPGPSHVPRWLRLVLRRGLSPDPAQRWSSVEELIAELRRGQTRARVRWVGIGLATIGVAYVAADAWRARAHQLAIEACEADGAAIAQMWPGADESARTSLRDAMLSTGVNHAANTSTLAQQWLDRWSADWREARTRACLAHEVEHVWSDRLASLADECLLERRDALEAALERLGSGERAATHMAVTVAAYLPAVSGCTDPAELSRRTPLPPGQRDEIRRIRAALGGPAVTAGSADARAAATREILVEADQLGWPPLRALARLALGNALDAAGDFAAAEHELIEAYTIASTAAANDLALRAANRLVFLVGKRLARGREGRLWSRLGEIEIQRLGLGEIDLRRATWLSHLAAIEDVEGRHVEAVALVEQALQIHERLLGPEHPEVATDLNNLAALYQKSDEEPRAESLHERALAIREQSLGPEHPDLVMSLSNLAVAKLTRGDATRAEELLQRALQIHERALGPDHPDIATVLNNLADVREAQRDFAEAIRLHDRAVAVLERALPTDHPQIAWSLVMRARVHAARGAHVEARADFERAQSIYERSIGPDDTRLLPPLRGLAEISSAAGNLIEARALYERAAEICDAHDRTGPEAVEIRFALARALWDAGEDRARVRALLARARADASHDATIRAALDRWIAEHDVTLGADDARGAAAPP